MSVETKDGHPAMDYPEHLRTYKAFIQISVAAIVIVSLILFGMLVMLV